MSADWGEVRIRHRLLAEVVATVEATGDPAVVRRAEVDEVFGGLDGLLLAAHHRWATAVFARLDAVLEDAPDDADAAVAQVWRTLAARHRGLRALLDAHRDRPDLVEAEQRLRTVVARDLGVDPDAGTRQAPARPAVSTARPAGRFRTWSCPLRRAVGTA